MDENWLIWNSDRATPNKNILRRPNTEFKHRESIYTQFWAKRKRIEGDEANRKTAIKMRPKMETNAEILIWFAGRLLQFAYVLAQIKFWSLWVGSGNCLILAQFCMDWVEIIW
jgi:hypothetical protein